MQEIVLVSFLGPDQPKQFMRLMAVLDLHGLDILDVGQEVIHDQLTLGMVVSGASTPIALAMKELLLVASEIGLTVRFKPISDSQFSNWVGEGGRTRLVVTVFAKKLSAKNLQQVSQVISAFGFNIESLNRLSGRVHPGDEKTDVKHCLEFGVRGDLGLAQELRKACLSLAAQNNIDIAVQEDNPYRRNRRLVCFDMDSTLIEQEVIDELAKAAGVGEAVSAITEQAMRGELDFDQSFRQRVALLKGLPETALQKVASQLKVSEGAVTLMQTLKKLGYRTAILSGGFVYFAEVLQQLLGIDEVYANHLHIENGLVTGQVVGEIVNGENKAKKLRALAQKHNISLEQVIAVGDGANDLPMLSIAGLGVAFRAKPLVRENAQQAISNVGLDGLLYLLGVRDYDQL